MIKMHPIMYSGNDTVQIRLCCLEIALVLQMTTLFFFYLGRKQRLILLFFKARPKTLQVPGCPGPHSQDDPFTAQ